MSRLRALQNVSTKREFAELLGLNPSFLTYTLYIVNPESNYVQFSIEKKSGGERKISAPTRRLKSIQSALSDLLFDCLDEIQSDKFPSSKNSKDKKSRILKIKYSSSNIKWSMFSHGFERNRSIITNAMMHLHKKMC